MHIALIILLIVVCLGPLAVIRAFLGILTLVAIVLGTLMLVGGFTAPQGNLRTSAVTVPPQPGAQQAALVSPQLVRSTQITIGQTYTAICSNAAVGATVKGTLQTPGDLPMLGEKGDCWFVRSTGSYFVFVIGQGWQTVLEMEETK